MVFFALICGLSLQTSCLVLILPLLFRKWDGLHMHIQHWFQIIPTLVLMLGMYPVDMKGPKGKIIEPWRKTLEGCDISCSNFKFAKALERKIATVLHIFNIVKVTGIIRPHFSCVLLWFTDFQESWGLWFRSQTALSSTSAWWEGVRIITALRLHLVWRVAVYQNGVLANKYFFVGITASMIPWIRTCKAITLRPYRYSLSL